MDSKNVWCRNSQKTVLLCLSALLVLALVATALFVLSPVAVAAAAVPNKIVGDDGVTDYALSCDSTYGTAPAFVVPKIAADDVAAEDYGKTGDPVKLRLALNGKAIGEFNRSADSYQQYINATMPAGEYTLTVVVNATANAGATSKEYTFNVAPQADMPSTQFVALRKALLSHGEGNPFVFDYTNGQAQFPDAVEEVSSALAALQTEVDKAARSGVWKTEAYDSYYKVEIRYNLRGMDSSEYRTATRLRNEEHAPAEAGIFQLYFMICCNNYAPMADANVLTAAEFEAARKPYVCYAIVRKAVAVPEIKPVMYNGELQKADVPSSSYYGVAPYDGFLEATTADNKHYVTLRLVNNEYLYWVGKNIGETDVVVEFVILQAENNIDALSISSWNEGDYDREDPGITASAKFGQDSIVYRVTSVDESVVYYDSSTGVNNLKDLKAGTYYLKASLKGTTDYKGDVTGFNFQVLPKVGLPAWAVAIIAVASAALVVGIFIILWKRGVFEILTGKLVLAIRTQATLDATIAAVRANKIAEESRKSIAAAKAREEAEALAQAEAEAAKANESAEAEAPAEPETTSTEE